MAKKKTETGLANVSSPQMTNPGLNNISNPINFGLTPERFSSLKELLKTKSTTEEKRLLLQRELGLRKTKKKYPTKEARKEAAKVRAKQRRAEKKAVYKEFGIAPAPKGPKRTTEEKKLHRSEKGKSKRNFLKEMAKQNPDIAKKFGIDISRFR